ncbi:DMP19 family protein [Desulforamulus aquiferis]|uniref:DUF4375 domain-containing protein n=1 Tax=Desulforamulus aquiferis TaxID=1397668 RepID=A0AAW7ZD38_9FIRM|nr:DUF4375 domain-containing protein [Desulforamulus aquiferis]MDO7787149.1 DUF4375 domain-containing protein [Desulforamulus aquiferis]RYD04834.1 hypothetical protein N752_12980 [Desulforamulus aquiferis]
MSRLNNEDWQESWFRLCEKQNSEGYDRLTPDEKLWFNIRGLIDSVNNGGIISFYYNSYAFYLEDTMVDLQRLHAVEVLDILVKTNELFPNGKPPKDSDKRNELINSWEDGVHDDLLGELNNKFYSLEENLELELETVVKRIILKNC